MEKRTWEAPKTLAFDLQEALGNCEDGQTAMGAGSDCNTGETPLFSYESCFFRRAAVHELFSG